MPGPDLMSDDLSLAALLDESAARHASATALIEPAVAGPPRTLTFGALQEASRQVAAQLVACGIGRGDLIAVWLPNCLEWIAVEYAAAVIGAAVLGVNTRYSARELSRILGLAGLSAVVAPATFLNLDFAGTLRLAVGQLPADGGSFRPPAVLLTGATAETDTAAFDIGGGVAALRLGLVSPARGAGPVDAAAIDADRPAAAPPELTGSGADLLNLFATSGSTGAPKLAAHDQAALARHAQNVAASFDLRSGDRLWCGLPLCGVFGLNGALAALAAGAACLLEPTVDPASALAHLAEYEITHVNGGDDLFLRLMDCYRDEPADLSHWRRGGIANFGGRAGYAASLIEERVGARLSGIYGSSECFALMAAWPGSWPAAERSRAGGRLVSPGLTVRVASVRDGQVLAPGESGELQFRGYSVLRSYYRSEAATAAAFTPDGWFRSGDLGCQVDADSFTYLCRIGDVLRLRGFLVEPADIEIVLAEHPAIDAARVVGLQQDGAEVAVAFVRLSGGDSPSQPDISAFCQQNLASYKVPACIIIVTEFPVMGGPNGDKVLTGQLREQARRYVDGLGEPGPPAPWLIDATGRSAGAGLGDRPG